MDTIFPDQDLIRRWLEGELSADEWAQLNREEKLAPWIDRAAHLRVPATRSHEAAWELLARQIDESAPSHEATIRPVYRRRRWAIAAAAVVLIGMLGLWLWPAPVQEIVAYNGNQVSYILPDGSEVVLNAQSTLSFDPSEWDQSRGVFLEGEAWIHVEKGSAFKVHTALGTVEVLGTEFNVFARKGLLDVACFSGRVSVANKSDRIVLNPGDAVRSSGTSGLTPYLVDSERAASWKKGEFYFDKVPFKFVIQELERQFDVEVLYSSTIAKRTYTGFFSNSVLEEALEMVCAPMDVTYKFEESKSRISLIE